MDEVKSKRHPVTIGWYKLCLCIVHLQCRCVYAPTTTRCVRRHKKKLQVHTMRISHQIVVFLPDCAMHFFLSFFLSMLFVEHSNSPILPYRMIIIVIQLCMKILATIIQLYIFCVYVHCNMKWARYRLHIHRMPTELKKRKTEKKNRQFGVVDGNCANNNIARVAALLRSMIATAKHVCSMTFVVRVFSHPAGFNCGLILAIMPIFVRV